jgi:putative heme iron utilization protein
MTAAQQRASLGISAHAEQGLVVVEVDRPGAIVTLTPGEARRFWLWFERAYQDAHQDRDALVGGREARR